MNSTHWVLEPEEFESSSKNEEKKSEEIEILPNTGMRVCICIQGWLWRKSELTTMWTPIRDADPSSEIYSLKWETKELLNLGNALVKTVTTLLASKAAKIWLVSMSTLAAAFFAAMAIPLAIILVAGAIDNSWSVVHNRAKKVGRLLAETLVERVQGNRPVTLIAVSLGSQVLFSCLQSLLEFKKKGINVDGIIENVFFIGSACISDPSIWKRFKSIVAGRIVNGYCKTDWILGIVHRTAGMTFKAAGLDAIECDSVENIDLTDYISGHLSYKKELGKILPILQIGRSINEPSWISTEETKLNDDKEIIIQ